jgi:hypothetical protein
MWKTSIDLPLYHEVKFKFGNTGPGARNSGYEGDGQGDRSYVVGTGGNTYGGTYDFIDVAAPPTVIEGTVRGSGAPLTGALVEATTADPKKNYALTFSDGTYTLFVPAGAHTLQASADGFDAATRAATSPQSGADFDLSAQTGTVVGKYRIDGKLSDWTAPKVNVQSPAEGGFGPDNNWLTLQADSDATYLYLAYTYRVSGNSAIVYLDTQAGGATQADGFDAWRRAATFSGGMGGVDAFIARYENQAPELRLVSSASTTSVVGSGAYTVVGTGTLPAQAVEMAIPWTALGLSGAPVNGVNVVAGIFGGDGYGAGDIVPDAGSTPAGANAVTDCYNSCRATFTAPLNVK